MYTLDRERFVVALKNRGYRSIGDLARALRIHRNTIHYYLSGKGVFPAQLERILSALDLSPTDALTEKKAARPEPTAVLAPVIDRLAQRYPEVTFVLFGSRSRGVHHPYSDLDIGLFSPTDLPQPVFRTMARELKEFAEGTPLLVDVTNLSRADPSFLRSAAGGKFLGGSLQGWTTLQGRVSQ